MLIAYLNTLKNKNIFLCSQSKPRRNLLEQLGLQLNIYPSSFEEDLDKSLYKDPKDYVKDTCQGKVNDVLKKFQQENINWDIAIFCDTIIVLNDKIIEKPENEQQAADFLRTFKNNTQYVHTACFVLFNDKQNNKVIERHVIDTCKVIFGDIPEECIIAYSKTDHFKGKCGGYGIQDVGASFIEKIEGQHSTVIGLPVYSLCKILVDNIKELNWQ
ncbi:septum formation protein Maf protein (macronuclear) [Tetrahymena thermophila SB210]|uniref:Septum formation protein Maf protein n=1 Tax=Tetrahymena thermophila (strain SB210) TaxID=312017 RepID=I7MHM0_TETTS|nr:septum formation protein Maf protein [Tetrahymena thermophila SB210]EAS03096.1 septum formation protein Maf protein [Tetrahymena thermophila SB210]|eukprot:XP_001023341.1 septum formation protein Maf protein [Tetrahymena thermophila SB210]